MRTRDVDAGSIVQSLPKYYLLRSVVQIVSTPLAIEQELSLCPGAAFPPTFVFVNR